jgi:urea transport system permease protein
MTHEFFEDKLVLTGFLEALFNGISIGAVLLVAALGLSIIFGLMGVINMAHGELMMLGAYTILHGPC